MKKVKICALALAGLVLVGCGKSYESYGSSNNMAMHETKNDNMSKSSFDINEKYLDGKEFKLSELKGQKVYVKLWASWCSVCLAGLEDADTLSTNKDFKVISMIAPNHNNEKSLNDFKTWYEKLGYKNLPVVVDEDASVFKELGIRAYPSYLVIDSEGNVAKKGVGHLDNNKIIEMMKTVK